MNISKTNLKLIIKEREIMDNEKKIPTQKIEWAESKEEFQKRTLADKDRFKAVLKKFNEIENIPIPILVDSNTVEKINVIYLPE